MGQSYQTIAALSDMEESPYQIYLLADELFEDKNYEEALSKYEKIKDRRIDSMIWKKIALCFMRLKQFDQAGDKFIEFVDYIFKTENNLLIHIVSHLLLLACGCYLAAGKSDKIDNLPYHHYLYDRHKEMIKSRNFYRKDDFDLMFLDSFIKESN